MTVGKVVMLIYDMRFIRFGIYTVFALVMLIIVILGGILFNPRMGKLPQQQYILDIIPIML